jgi:hypothetical protein
MFARYSSKSDRGCDKPYPQLHFARVKNLEKVCAVNNREYRELIAKLGMSKPEFAAASGVPLGTVKARCRTGVARITARAELELLRFAAGRMLGWPLSPPMPRIRHAREAPSEFFEATVERKRERSKAAAAERDQLNINLFTGMTSKPSPPKPTPTCAAPNCGRAVEAMANARFCPQHAMEAAWLGFKRFK